MAPGVDEMLEEPLLTRLHRSVVDVTPVPFVELQCVGFGDVGVFAELPCDQT